MRNKLNSSRITALIDLITASFNKSYLSESHPVETQFPNGAYIKLKQNYRLKWYKVRPIY